MDRALRRCTAERARHEAPLQAVLLPRWDSEPRRAAGPGLDSRGRRARLLALSRGRRGIRQSRADRDVRRRRRRGRDGCACDIVVGEQVLEPAQGWRRHPHPSPQRLQDREPDTARANPRARPHRAADRIRLAAVFRRRRRSSGRPLRSPSGYGRDARRGARRRRAHQARLARGRRRAAGRREPWHRASLADDRPQNAEGVDRACDR